MSTEIQILLTPLKHIILSPTERRMINLLKDGMPHKRDEIHKCMDDDLSSPLSVHEYLKTLRRKIMPYRYGIMCEYIKKRPFYRLVVLLCSIPDKEEGLVSCFQDLT